MLIPISGLFIGCGVKSSPLPPKEETLKNISNINIKQQGNIIVLNWQYQNSKNIKFTVFLNGKKLNSKIYKKGNFYWVEHKFKHFGSPYCFQIKVSNDKTSKVSNLKCLSPIKYAKFEDILEIKQAKEKIILKWNKKKGKFFIYKGDNKTTIPPIPYFLVLDKNEFEDNKVVSGKKYCYYITKELKKNIETNRVYSNCTVYKDIYPPQKPRVSVIKKQGKLIIILGDIKDKDFIGFLIKKNGKSLTEIPLKTYYFVDKNWKKGDTYLIYAVDKNNNKSKPVYLKVE